MKKSILLLVLTVLTMNTHADEYVMNHFNQLQKYMESYLGDNNSSEQYFAPYWIPESCHNLVKKQDKTVLPLLQNEDFKNLYIDMTLSNYNETVRTINERSYISLHDSDIRNNSDRRNCFISLNKLFKNHYESVEKHEANRRKEAQTRAIQAEQNDENLRAQNERRQKATVVCIGAACVLVGHVVASYYNIY